MLKTMADKPVVFALANPTPEIDYSLAKQTRPDAVIATGRSDYPNQVNNVLCFPFIFRGAIDVRARCISEEMKLAAASALATLAIAEVPDEVLIAYKLDSLRFGTEYLIPKPFDPRVLLTVAPAVAKAAIESGVAASQEFHINAYKDRLVSLQSLAKHTVRKFSRRLTSDKPKRVVFPDSSSEPVLRACHHIVRGGIAQPILLGSPEHIQHWAQRWQIELHGVEILDHFTSPMLNSFAMELLKTRARKGIDKLQARALAEEAIEFGLMMVKTAHADCFVGGISKPYPEILRPALKLIGLRDGTSTASGFYMLLFKDRTLFLSDCTINIHPTAEQLADIACNTARAAQFLGHTPKIALLSYSNFGGVPNQENHILKTALKIIHQKQPQLMAEGEMQAHLALSHQERQNLFPFSILDGTANVLIMPNLNAASIACRMLVSLSDAEMIGPILSGMKQPINLIPQEAGVQDIVNMTTISALEAQEGML